MSHEDPHADDDRIERLQARLVAIQDRAERTTVRRKRLFDEIARVELFLIRRRAK